MAAQETFSKTMEQWTNRMMNNEQGRQFIGEQTERFWKSEDAFVEDMQDFFEGWCERRHDAAKTAIDFGKLMENGVDNTEVMEAWSELCSKAMQRFSDDVQAQSELMQKFWSKTAPGSLFVMFPMMSRK